MPHHKYLIIGGGMTADSAVRGIRSLDAEGSIGIISQEPHPPYDRPPLTKGLWRGMEEDRIWRDTQSLGAQLHLGRRVLRIDPEPRIATDDRGSIYSYEKLLLATGSEPRLLDDAVPQVLYFRTFEDYKRLRTMVDKGKSFAVIGGGFIGTEVAAALAVLGKKVTLLFQEDRLCQRVLTKELGESLNELFAARGVAVRPGVEVKTVRRSGPSLLVSIGGGAPETLKVDGVIAGLGCRPVTTLAQGVGLEVNDGIVVDASFRTTNPDIFAAGDVAAFWSSVLGRTLRVEHEDHANSSGMLAGRIMAGAVEEYDHLPSFHTSVFDVSFEGVGEIAPDMETIEDWASPGKRGAVYFMRGGRVRGVLLWNVLGKLGAARELIRGDSSFFQFDPSQRISLD